MFSLPFIAIIISLYFVATSKLWLKTMSENSLLNIGDLTKPATALIEKISGAVWLGYEPFHSGRMARADAYAAKLKAETSLEISDIERRGLERLAVQAGKEQKNIENVTLIAIEHLNEDANPEEIDDDWVSFFFDKARIVSYRFRDEMTHLARLLVEASIMHLSCQQTGRRSRHGSSLTDCRSS